MRQFLFFAALTLALILLSGCSQQNSLGQGDSDSTAATTGKAVLPAAGDSIGQDDANNCRELAFEEQVSEDENIPMEICAESSSGKSCTIQYSIATVTKTVTKYKTVCD